MIDLGERGVIALCGPSGVGKGHTKRMILDMAGVEFAEPVVASTRHARIDDDASRLAGLSDPDFDRLVEQGDVILPHRPFRVDGSPRYGFLMASLLVEKPILTEVHSSIIRPFHETFGGQALIIGMVASPDTLRANIMARQGSEYDGVGIDLRVESARQEVAEIYDAYEHDAIDQLYSLNLHERNRAQYSIATTVRNHVGSV